jgi:hypothetical protein
MSSNIKTDYNQIKNKVVAKLVASPDKIFNEIELFNKCYSDLILPNDPTLKFKYKLVIRQLMSEYDNIVVKKLNNLYYIYYKENKDIDINNISSDTKIDSLDQPNELNNFIIDNELFDELNYVDPENGNTIFHDLLSSNNYVIVQKLLDSNKLNIHCKNNYGQTPINKINDVKMTNIIINYLVAKQNEIIDINNKHKSKLIEYKMKQDKLENDINQLRRYFYIFFIFYILTFFISK